MGILQFGDIVTDGDDVRHAGDRHHARAELTEAEAAVFSAKFLFETADGALALEFRDKLRAIAGAEDYGGGEIRLSGRRVVPGQREAAQRAGIGYIPEDRRAEGIVAQLGVAENVTMTITRQLSDRLGLLRPARRDAARTSRPGPGPSRPRTA